MAPKKRGGKTKDGEADKALASVLKCFVCTVADLNFGWTKKSPKSMNDGTYIAVLVPGPVREFLSRLESDAEELDLLVGQYGMCAVSARLEYGDFNLRDGMCRDEAVGTHFLPLLAFVKTKADAERWLREFEAIECDTETYEDNDRGMSDAMEYVRMRCLPCVSSTEDYVMRMRRVRSGGEFYIDAEVEEMKADDDEQEEKQEQERADPELTPELAELRDAFSAGACPTAAVKKALSAIVASRRGGVDSVLTTHGQTALALAAYSGGEQCVQTLIKAGANVNAVQDDGASPLMICARNGHVACVKALLKAGANANAQSGLKQYTALMAAALNKHAAVVRMLVAAGARVDLTSRSGKAALDYAKEVRSAECESELRAATAAASKAPKRQKTR